MTAMGSVDVPGGRSTPVWILAGWSRTFERNRLLFHALVIGPLAAACMAYGHFIWLAVFFIGFWPFPYRARCTAQGLEVSWLFVRETLRFAEIESLCLGKGFRHLLVFRYESALEIALGGGRRATIVKPHGPIDPLLAHADTPDELDG